MRDVLPSKVVFHLIEPNCCPSGVDLNFQTWNGMDGFWQNGIAIETMANAMKFANHSRYLSVVKVR